MAELESRQAKMYRTMMLAGTQRGFACWLKACAEIAQGLMQASTAYLEAARALYAAEASDWTAMATHTTSHEAGEHLLSNARARYEAAVNAYRKINDDFAAHVFRAAETLMSAFTDEPADAPFNEIERRPGSGRPRGAA